MSGIRPRFRSSSIAALIPAFVLAFILASGLGLSHADSPALPIVPMASLTDPKADSLAHARKRDSIMAILYTAEAQLKYQTGTIKLGDGMALAKLPDGFRYLDPGQTAMVLSEMWGNPPNQQTLGMILAPGMTPLKENAWAVIIQFDEDGYVKDDDAEKIDYDDLLKDIQKSVREENKAREKEGYEPLEMVGWAEKPHYDKAEHKLHWAKEIRFGSAKETTLNYNIRVLGRKGVLVLNAVAGMDQLATVKEGMKPVISAVEFDEGHRYAEFDPKIDKVATYGIAGLVAGGILAKVGFFKILIGVLLAAKKFVILGVVAFMAYFRKLFGKKPEKKEIEDVKREMSDEKKEIKE